MRDKMQFYCTLTSARDRVKMNCIHIATHGNWLRAVPREKGKNKGRVYRVCVLFTV